MDTRSLNVDEIIYKKRQASYKKANELLFGNALVFVLGVLAYLLAEDKIGLNAAYNYDIIILIVFFTGSTLLLLSLGTAIANKFTIKLSCFLQELFYGVNLIGGIVALLYLIYNYKKYSDSVLLIKHLESLANAPLEKADILQNLFYICIIGLILFILFWLALLILTNRTLKETSVDEIITKITCPTLSDSIIFRQARTRDIKAISKESLERWMVGRGTDPKLEKHPDGGALPATIPTAEILANCRVIEIKGSVKGMGINSHNKTYNHIYCKPEISQLNIVPLMKDDLNRNYFE